MCQKWSGMSEISRANQLVHEYIYSANHFLVFLFFFYYDVQTDYVD